MIPPDPDRLTRPDLQPAGPLSRPLSRTGRPNLATSPTGLLVIAAVLVVLGALGYLLSPGARVTAPPVTPAPAPATQPVMPEETAPDAATGADPVVPAQPAPSGPATAP